MIENIAAVLIGIFALGLGSMALRGLFRLTMARRVEAEPVQAEEPKQGAVYARFVPRTQVPMKREDKK